MEFNTEELINMFKNLNLHQDIEPIDIPHLHLYMDQVIQLFDNNLSHCKRNSDDKLLTKTMINNYTKDKLLMPVKNKKYSREHIILMILIYNLKQSLSIGDIKILFNDLVLNLQDTKSSLIDIDSFYSLFLQIKNNEIEKEETHLNDILSMVQETIEEKENSEYEKLLLTVLALTNSANIQKRMAEKIIDTYFSKKQL
ncbi:DUF1836 domain-containing protein [Clostridium sp.]|uniref:DUF1836 domain-containing protein n=1 Tax=Clostridium sp. TaxID=1506 RepID=UPI002FC69262